MLAGIDGVNPDNIPQDPTAAAKWWDGLSESDKQMYLAQHPEKIGATDGLPATTRDQANRVLLSEEIPRLRDDPDEEDRLAALEKLQGALDYQADGNQALPPSYLLGYSNEGDGRAIVAVGNPDTAKNTAVMVPGMATTLDGLPKDLARGNNLLMASDQNSTPGSTSVITWYGYDSPDGGGAMTDKSAEEGAPDLRRFTDGLGAARGPADSGDGHTTLIGHSYGTVVIGEAAKDDKIPGVDDIVVAGSPGMHASHAEDLGVGENHVWVAEGLTDPIPELGRSAHGERSWESPLRPVVPTDSAFGGRHFSAWDSAGHGEYWEQDKESLDNQANIVTGNYDEVK
jgi:pimeloyl-ACP methyl ester carboxylesterase